MESLYINWYTRRKGLPKPYLETEEVLKEKESLCKKTKSNLLKVVIVFNILSLAYGWNFFYNTLEMMKAEEQRKEFCNANNQGDVTKYPIEFLEKRDYHEAKALNPFYTPELK